MGTLAQIDLAHGVWGFRTFANSLVELNCEFLTSHHFLKMLPGFPKSYITLKKKMF